MMKWWYNDKAATAAAGAAAAAGFPRTSAMLQSTAMEKTKTALRTYSHQVPPCAGDRLAAGGGTDDAPEHVSHEIV
jgi:hypothetical protein